MRSATEQLVDELLVLRCQEGEPEAMAALAGRWQKRLWQYAYRLTARSDAAWDVVQEAWVAMIRGLRKLDDPARFRGWAYRIVTHKAADWVRRHQRRREEPRDLAHVPHAGDGHVAQSDRHVDLHAVLGRLAHPHRIVLCLRYLAELPVAEIARVLAVPAGTVKSRLHHARQAFKQQWQARAE